jgi:nucleoside phosphorylase/CheY-like chemotaxis protein
MKILIADDSQSKTKKIVGVLTNDFAVSVSDIQVAANATEARRNLKDTRFDLFIMDILLPRKIGETPTRESSIELLEEITEEDFYLKPDHILGLTAYPEEAIAAEPHFKNHLWSILRFEETSDEWTKPIGNCIEYIRRQKSASNKPGYDVDVCIVTALQEPEMAAVQRLPWRWSTWAPIDDMTFVRPATFSIQGVEHTAVTAVASRMGMISTALLATKLINRFRPKLIVMTGICAGVREKTNLGDIIFAETSWDWQSGKRIRDKENSQFAMDPHHISANEFLRSRIQQMQADRVFLSSIRSGWPNPPDQELRLHIGPLASGSAVLADGQTVTQIREQQRTLLGVEMEGYGLFAAAAAVDHPTPFAMIVKSVCDYADPDKDNDFQAYAAYTSAQLLWVFLQRYFAEVSQCAAR